MNYTDMCDEIRALMAEEVEIDGVDLYGSSWFNEDGAAQWKRLLLEACGSGSDVTLAEAIRANRCLVNRYQRKTKNGFSSVAVPYNAHETIAESNFSRFYLRALCRYALDRGVTHLVGYRAMAVENPRAGSEEKIGAEFDAAEMLVDIRSTMASVPLLGMPPGVGSGILACLP